jgi:hypothetical protein
LALLRQRLAVARGPIRPDEVGGGCTEIERLEPVKACQPLRLRRALLVVSDQAQQITSMLLATVAWRGRA